MKNYSELKAHKFADMFPMISEREYPAFRRGIEENGLLKKIVLLNGVAILDGRNRHRALKDLGLVNDPAHYVNFEDLPLNISPFRYVVSENLDRRHLSESQRAMVAARMADMRQGERTDIKPDAPLNDDAPLDTTEPSADMQKVSQTDAAAMLQVSPRMVTGANQILKHGIDELQRMVEAGEIAVTVGETVAKLARSQQEKLLADLEKPDQLKTRLNQFKRDRREAELAEKQGELPDERFGLIYADPEWKFVTRSDAGKSRSAENHYPCSPYEEIMRRRVQDIAADDCVLFMWATVPCLMEAICVLMAWGFVVLVKDPETGDLVIDRRRARYVSQWSWLKTNIANGYWGRGQHEILLIATRGNPVAPAMGTQPPSVIEAATAPIEQGPQLDDAAVVWQAQTGHSVKPDIFAEWIERLYPNTKKIELNARRARPGWSVWGNEAPEPVEHLEPSPAAPQDGLTAAVVKAFGVPADMHGDQGSAIDGEAGAVAVRDLLASGGPATFSPGLAGESGAEYVGMDMASTMDQSAVASGGAEIVGVAASGLIVDEVQADAMPPLAAYEGKHNKATDALIRYGYQHEKPISHICSWLSLPASKAGIVKGRANRLGLTDQARIVKNNKARAKKESLNE